ncbi:MAG: hypothetical protein EBU88_15040, partial [Acidobacteria bacterium]|nr:hypothetical protein [Acidobacteriota bacterium]
MNSNPGRRSRAPIVEKIISHFDGEIPPVIARIDIVGVTRTMTDDEIRLARLCAATPGFAVIELVELKSAEVTVKSFKSKKNFRTHFKLNVHNEVEASCSCLEAAKMGCNHILTAAIVLREVAEAEDYLRGDQDLGSDWRFNLSRLIGSKSLTRSKKLLEREPMVLFFQMVESFSGFEAHPMMMGAGEIPADVRHYQDKLGEYLLDLVTRRELPQPFREVKLGELSEINLINATGLSLSLIKSALDQLQLNRVSYGTPRVYFWEGLADQLVFLGQQGGKINARLQVIGYPLPVKMEILKRESGLRLNPVVDLPEGPVTLLGSGVSIFYSQPLWLRAGSTIFRINLNLESFNQLRSSGTIRVPSDGVAEFYERHLPEIIGHLPFELSNTEFTDLPATTPVPRIYLTEKDQMLRIALRFGYGDFEVGALRRVPSHSFSTSEGPLIRIPRKADEELRWYRLLEGSSTGLKSTSRQERTTAEIFTLRKGVHPYDFLTRHLPRLVESGFEVYGESELTSRVNRAKPTISFQVSSGIDWFDLKAVASWGDQPVPLESLRRAMRRDERFIKLADGTLGEIPADWLDKYRHLFGLSEPQDDGCRVSRHHITLLNDLFADADSLKFDRKFEQACEWLGNFDGITPRLVPDSFRGELRLYQKAGFDWLYFLREAGFGGCLADDMG